MQPSLLGVILPLFFADDDDGCGVAFSLDDDDGVAIDALVVEDVDANVVGAAALVFFEGVLCPRMLKKKVF